MEWHFDLERRDNLARGGDYNTFLYQKRQTTTKSKLKSKQETNEEKQTNKQTNKNNYDLERGSSVHIVLIQRQGPMHVVRKRNGVLIQKDKIVLSFR